MINKSLFAEFLEKSYLNKTVESFILNVNDKKLSCDIKVGTSLIGSIEMNNFDCEDCLIGVYNPDVLIKMISILDNDVKLEIKKRKDSDDLVYIKLKDKKAKEIKYVTQEKELFDVIEKKKAKVIDYEVEIKLNSEIIDGILKSKSCIESTKISFEEKDSKLFAIFGHSNNNTNQIKLELDTIKVDDIGLLHFNSDNLKEILSTNSKKFMEATMEISMRGIMRIFFKSDNGQSEYYLIKLQDEVE